MRKCESAHAWWGKKKKEEEQEQRNPRHVRQAAEPRAKKNAKNDQEKWQQKAVRWEGREARA